MDYPFTTFKSSLRRSFDRFPEMTKLLSVGREDILELWMTNEVVMEIFQRFRIDSYVFGKEFGYPIIDSFIDILKAENNTEKHVYMMHFFIYLKNQDIEINDLISICNRLKWATIGYISNKDIPDITASINDIHYVFDDYIAHILTYFTNTIFHLLEKYKLATDHINTVVIGDTEDIIIYVNNEACNLSGYKEDELIGKHQNIMTHPDMTREVTENILEVIKSKKIWTGIIKNRTKSGDPYWIKTTIIPIIDAYGTMIEYISIGSDITDAHIAEEELRQSLAKLQDLDEKKDEFINIASHELRTPMTAISGYISMILDGDAGEITEDTKIYLEQVFKSSKQLITLINDMLDIARLESGKGKLYYEDIEMKGLLEEVVGNLRPLAILKHQHIELDIEYEELFYRTDNRKCQQVLVNIIGNALKYTNEGGRINVHSWIKNTTLFVRVEDTGIGIPKQHLSKIFEKFSQVKNSLTRDINGTGLGLAITKTIVEKFFGKIEVESEEGKGSVFTISLPLPRDLS